MADDDDEEVLFENSPLYQHLMDVGVEDLTYEHVKKPPEDSKGQQNHGNVEKEDFLSFVRNMFLIFLGVTSIKQELQIMENFHNQALVQRALKSKAIEEDDKNAIDGVIGSREINQMQAYNSSRKTKILKTCLVSCVIAYYYNRVMNPGIMWNYKPVTDLVAFGTALYLLVLVIKYSYVYWRTKVLEKKYSVITSTLTIGELLIKYARKSLRLIQEAELVARGFTLVSQNSAVWRLEQNSVQGIGRQCPQMRKILFLSTRSCLLCYKEATMWLLTECPLGKQVDRIMSYLAGIPLEEYGPCLQTGEEGPESERQLYSITDGFSVAALKTEKSINIPILRYLCLAPHVLISNPLTSLWGILQLCHLQQSEYFRHVILTLLQGDEKKIPLAVKSANSVKWQIKVKVDQLEGLYNVHSCYLVDKESKDTKPSDRSNNASPLCDLHVAVHSLDLHLQAALIRIRSLSALLEHKIEKEEREELDPENSQEDMLQQIKQELEACKGCWEEGLSRLKKMERQKNKTDDLEKPLVKPVSPVKQKQAPVDLFEMGDPVIEDQVFEAYIDEEEFEDRDLSWEEYLTPEEKAKKKREKDEAVRVLTELKSVISVRAVEMQKREKIALERTRGTCNITKDLTNMNTDTLSCDTGLKDSCSNQQYDRDMQNSKSEPSVEEEMRTNTEKFKKSSFDDSSFPCDQELQISNGGVCNESNSVSQNLGNNNHSQERESYESNETKVEDSECVDSHSCLESKSYETGNETSDSDLNMTLSSFRGGDVEDRLGRLPGGANLSFTASLAAMAVKRSQQMGLQMESFGDEDSDEDDIEET